MKRDLRFEQIYPYPPDRVWEAITDPEAMADWLMPNNFVPQIGHQFQFRTKPAPGFDGIVNCEVIAIERPHVLAFTWKGGGIDTVVTFTLQTVDDVRRIQSALKPGDAVAFRIMRSAQLPGNKRTWQSFVVSGTLPNE